MPLSSSFFTNKNLLGVDFGEKVIGTAIFRFGRDPYPMPHKKIINKNLEQIKKEFEEILEEEFVDIFIVGVPYLLDGGETNSTKKAKDFIMWLKESFPKIEVFDQDETLSTFEAKERMKRDPRYNFQVDPKMIDTLSASIILEDFLKEIKKEESDEL